MTHEDLLEMCLNIIRDTPEDSVPRVVLPVPGPVNDEQETINLIPGDPSSPEGTILRGDDLQGVQFEGCLTARYNAFAMVAWIATQMELAEASEDELAEREAFLEAEAEAKAQVAAVLIADMIVEEAKE